LTRAGTRSSRVVIGYGDLQLVPKLINFVIQEIASRDSQMDISFNFEHKLQNCMVTAAAALALVGPAYSQTAAKASFERDLQPVLNRDCAGCHTSGGHAGGFRMDTFESFMAGGERGAPVVMGDLERSNIIKAISYGDPDLKMPPTKGKIPDEDAAVIRN
jgi:hypothetical protein